MGNISWSIPLDKLWNMINDDPQQFIDTTMVVAESAFDDADSKWWLYAYKPSEDDDSVVLSLETEESVIESASCASEETLVDTVKRLLSQVE